MSGAGKNAYLTNPKFFPTHFLLSKNAILLYSAYREALEGKYVSCVNLLRAVLENNLMSRYLIKKPEKIKDWHDPKRRIRVAAVRHELFSTDALLGKDYDDLYEALCFVEHADLRGAWTFATLQPGKSEHFIAASPFYDKTICRRCLRLLLFSIRHTIKPVTEVFGPIIALDANFTVRLNAYRREGRAYIDAVLIPEEEAERQAAHAPPSAPLPGSFPRASSSVAASSSRAQPHPSPRFPSSRQDSPRSASRS